MRRSVYLRSTLRQPVKTIFLLLLVGVISFTFLVRGLECALIYRETDRLGSYYRSIASLVPLEDDADYVPATDYLETLPEVKLVNRSRRTSGIMPSGHYNADLSGASFTIDWQPPEVVSVAATNVLFYGEYRKSSITLYGYGEDKDGEETMFDFVIDKVVLGYPEYVSEGKRVTLFVEEEAAALSDTMEAGQRYLVRGIYDSWADERCLSKDGKYDKFILMPVKPSEGVWLEKAEEDIDLTAPEYAELMDGFKIAEENLRSLQIMAYKDVTARPEFQEVTRSGYLVEGRLPNAEDTALGRRVCSIDQSFAQLRGLKLGDTLEVDLLNVYATQGYTTPYNPSAVTNHFTAPRQKERYEIVGIHRIYHSDGVIYTSEFINVYVPYSTFPADFELMYPFDSAAYSFELNSPDGKDAFLNKYQDKLQELGFQAGFLENGWDNFTAAAEPMQRSALYNAVLFGVILLMALCLAVFAYFRFRRKDAVVCRALGDSAAKCVWGISAPMLLLGLVGIGTGGVLAWRYVSGHMETLLSGLEGYEPGAAALPLWTVFAFCGGILFLLMAVTLLFAIFLMKKPVLALLQGGGPQAKAPKAASAAPMPAFSGGGHGPAVEFAPSLAAPTPGARGWRYTLLFVRRHILRAPLKSLLALLLAGVFLVGLAAIQVTLRRDKAELDRLYQTIEVEVEITRANRNVISDVESYIGAASVNKILESGYIKDHYLETATRIDLYREDDQGRKQEQLAKKVYARSTNNYAKFAENWGGGCVTEYVNKQWGDYIFAVPKSSIDYGSIVLPRWFSDYKVTNCRIISEKNSMTGPHVVGYYDGGDQNSILVQFAMALELDVKYPYTIARFTLDPARNRELDDFLALVDEAISAPNAGRVDLSKIVWDQELKQVIEPLEQSIAFMEILYPITVALSLLVSAGAALLLVVLSSRESAILRVLGTEKRRVMAALCLQTVIPCVIGLLLGFAVTQLYTGAAGELLFPTLAQAGGYLLAAVLAAAVTAAALSKRNPLAALQAKE